MWSPSPRAVGRVCPAAVPRRSRMRTARVFEKGLALAVSLACTATLWRAVAAADHEHHKKHHRDEHSRVVVRSGWPARGPQCQAPAPVYYVPWQRPVRYYPQPVRYYDPFSARCYTPPPVYTRYYYDPYCRENFANLTIYLEHVRRHPHARFAFVMRTGFDAPLYACRYSDDRWVRWDGDGDDDDDDSD